MEILTYSGKEPSVLNSPHVETLLELFKSQNEVLRLALTTFVFVPESTCIKKNEVNS